MKKPIIQFENFTYQYRIQAAPTLYNINLTLYEGEKVLILGPSGSGKSTLANTLNGLIPFNTEGKMTGSLKIMGQSINELNLFELSKKVGTVLQDPDGQFIGLTVAEDIAFSLENDEVTQDEMKQRVAQVSHLVNLETLLENPPHTLSGGQKQRTALAGVMINQVDILLFDEPLASLDPATGKKTIELIDTLHQNTHQTIIMIEHRLEDVLHRSVDRIILMDQGKVIADSTPTELMSDSLLSQIGIREPLYISALKYAGCDLDALQGKLNLNLLDDASLYSYKEKLETFYHYHEKAPITPKDEVLLEFKDVSFGYLPHKPLLEHINFKVHQGEMISIVGKNGAGKSTLTKLICGFYHPSTGHLFLEGQDMTSLSIKQRSETIGMVMQNPNQMISKPMLYDEVALALRLQHLDEALIKERVEETLKICGLYSMRNWPISALSYGQKKRATIASILVSKPKLLILDEPTAGQDFKHYTEVMNFLKQLNQQGITIIIITHDMHLMLEYTHRSIVLSDGHIVGDTSPFHVLTDSELISQAHLKETSLYTLGVKANVSSPHNLVKGFIAEEKRRNTLC